MVWGLVVLGLVALQVKSAGAADDMGTVAVQGTEAITVEDWSQQLSHATGKKTITLLLRRGEAYRSMGHYLKAAADFSAARDQAKTLEQPLLEIVAAQCLGFVYFLQQKMSMAQSLLSTALESAKSLGQRDLAAACANRLGTVSFHQGHVQKARKLYFEALDFNQNGDDFALRATLYRNLARIEKDNTLAFEHLYTAAKIAQAIESPYEQAQLFLGIAAEAQSRDSDNTRHAFRYDALNQAWLIAIGTGSPRLISQAAGRMGRLYETRNRFEDALTLTEQALEAAQILDAHELLLKWEWQRGRILRAQGDRKQAIAAHWRAVYHIQAIRQDIPNNYREGCASFRETHSPLYLELADMLLTQSGQETDTQVKQSLLKEAQQAVESIKRSQLRDYFKDPCIDALSQQIESLSPGTAVIYPIIFSDRLELLSDIGGELHRRTSKIKKDDLEQTVFLLAGNLRNGLFHKQLSQDVYAWLIAPLEALFSKHQIHTLIFVPDGVLRMLPIAALHDNQQFLVEKYAVATEPGLSLLDPKPLPRGDMRTLLAGMSEAGPVVLNLPKRYWNTLSQISLSQKDRGVRGLSITKEQLNSETRSTPDPLSQDKAVEHVKQMLRLPGVEKEINHLSQNLPNQMLFNKSFLLERFSRELKEKNYRIIHIASHGFFGGTPEQNFIMTYNKCLNMTLLEDYIKPKQLAAQPVELITLSACQTAEGDERSPLGLAGVALKSGARSVMGSLWPVSDTATQQLLSDFYLNLKDEKVSKAEALQKAQIKLLKRNEFNHPFYWSAFILVGNWL